MKSGAIGILGGMGSVATADFFTRLVRAFPAEKEWDRPRVVIDNACQMPSRVRALLYGEREDELVEALAGGMAGLASLGCTDLVLCCNTSHVFLPRALPRARELSAGHAFQVWHILELLGEGLQRQGVSRVSLLATEGTILSRVYPQTLEKYGVTVECEGERAFADLRGQIEAVKQNAVDDAAVRAFEALCDRQACPDVVLGCTEFPVLAARAHTRARLHDPLEATLAALKTEYGV